MPNQRVIDYTIVLSDNDYLKVTATDIPSVEDDIWLRFDTQDEDEIFVVNINAVKYFKGIERICKKT